MFSQEHQGEECVKPRFEAGFNRANNIIVNINKNINSENIILLVSIVDEWIEKFYKSCEKSSNCKVIFIFDAYGEDYSCVTIFHNYLTSVHERYPKTTFDGVLQYAEGCPALMYMLLRERIANKCESNDGVKYGKSSLKFHVVNSQFKNEIAKLLIEKKIKKELLSLCFPTDEKNTIQYCGEVIFDEGFATVIQ